jgi:hypothetical protein
MLMTDGTEHSLAKTEVSIWGKFSYTKYSANSDPDLEFLELCLNICCRVC